MSGEIEKEIGNTLAHIIPEDDIWMLIWIDKTNRGHVIGNITPDEALSIMEQEVEHLRRSLTNGDDMELRAHKIEDPS